jgi:hypothetical protein
VVISLDDLPRRKSRKVGAVVSGAYRRYRDDREKRGSGGDASQHEAVLSEKGRDSILPSRLLDCLLTQPGELCPLVGGKMAEPAALGRLVEGDAPLEKTHRGGFRKASVDQRSEFGIQAGRGQLRAEHRRRRRSRAARVSRLARIRRGARSETIRRLREQENSVGLRACRAGVDKPGGGRSPHVGALRGEGSGDRACGQYEYIAFRTDQNTRRDQAPLQMALTR